MELTGSGRSDGKRAVLIRCGEGTGGLEKSGRGTWVVWWGEREKKHSREAATAAAARQRFRKVRVGSGSGNPSISLSIPREGNSLKYAKN